MILRFLKIPLLKPTLLHSLEELMYYYQCGAILLNVKLLKWVDQFTYLGSKISSTESDTIDERIGKAWTAIDKLSTIWVNLICDKIKRKFFQAVAVLLTGCTTWTLTTHLEKKLNANYTRMLRTVLDNSRR